MTVSYEAKAYSRGRGTVMGVATALILWFHFDMTTGIAAVDFLKTISDIGVDMFLLASGVGIYFATQKYSGYGAFLVSRMRRILPAFLIVSIPWYAWREWAFGSGDVIHFLKCITTLSFWLDGDWSCWYVSGILLLYVLTPAYLWAWKRWRWMSTATMIGALSFALAVQHTYLIVPFGRQLIFIGRVPAYLLGLSLGKAIWEEKTFHIHIPLALGVLAASVLALLSSKGYLAVKLPWVYQYMAYLPLMLCLSLLCARIPKNRILSGLGMVSLECYLIFEKIQLILMDQRWMWSLMDRGSYYRPLVAAVLTLLTAAVLRWLCSGCRLPKGMLDKSAGRG